MTNKNEDDFPVLMERHLKFQPASGGALVDIIVQIGFPKWTNPSIEATCAVAFRGGIGRVLDIRGIDPINAMEHAILFIESYLEPHEGRVRFFWPNGEEYGS